MHRVVSLYVLNLPGYFLNRNRIIENMGRYAFSIELQEVSKENNLKRVKNDYLLDTFNVINSPS